MLATLNAVCAVVSWYQGSFVNDFGIWTVVCLLCANRDEQEIKIEELKEKMNKYE